MTFTTVVVECIHEGWHENVYFDFYVNLKNNFLFKIYVIIQKVPIEFIIYHLEKEIKSHQNEPQILSLNFD